MSRFLKPGALHLLLALLCLSLIGFGGCGGGAGKDENDDGSDGPPVLFDLSGKILANDGSPIADAAVTARMGDGSNAVIDTATSAADGMYSLRVPGATAFYLHAVKAAYANSNSHIRELTATRVGVDLVMLLQGQADSLMQLLGAPTVLTPAHFLFLVRALDSSGAELAGVNVTVNPIGLLTFYRLADDTGYTPTGPTVACTAGGGCVLPQIAGYSEAINQGISSFRLLQGGGGTIALRAAPLIPGEVTIIVND